MFHVRCVVQEQKTFAQGLKQTFVRAFGMLFFWKLMAISSLMFDYHDFSLFSALFQF